MADRAPPGPATRRRLSVEDRRDELLAVCLRLVGTRDWDAVTMADVAAEAGISKGLLYHYFSSKPDLYLAAIRRAAAELSEVTRPDPTVPSRERLRGALRAHVDWIDEHDLAYRAVLRGGRSGDHSVEDVVEAARAEVLARVAEDAGLTAMSPSVRTALRGWVGFLEGACLEWLDTRATTRDELVDLVADMLSAALRAAR